MAFEWDLGEPPEEEQKKQEQPLQAAVTGNPLVDFFKASGGGLVRGGESAAGNISTAFGTLTGMQGLQDWGAKTSQDVAFSTPDYSQHPVLGAINAVAENVGGMIAPIGAGMVAAAAAPEEAAGGAAMAAGAAIMAPIGFGSAKTEAIARGADDATANRIGMESGAAQAGLFMLPMHQILSSGGHIVEKMLSNAFVNAGVGGILSFGQEEIMKANDIRPLPDGQEFNNSIYATLIGGLTGTVFGAFSPDEMSPRVAAIVDTHMIPQMQARLESQYVAEGMDPQQAAVKALDMVTDKRPQMIAETQAMYIRARFSMSNLLKGNYDIVDEDHTPEPLKVYSRDLAGNKSEYELTYMNSSPETNEQASKIINAAFSVVQYKTRVDADNKPVLDSTTGKEIKDVVYDPKTGFPVIEKTASVELPHIARILLHDAIVKGLEDKKDVLDLYNSIKQRTLPMMDRNSLIYTGAAHGEPSETQNSLFHFNMGAQKISEVAKNMLDSNGLMHPEIAKIYHMGDEEGVEQAWKLLVDSHRSQAEQKAQTIRENPVAATPEQNVVEHLGNQTKELLKQLLEGKMTEDEYHEAMGTLHSTLDPMFARGLVMKAAKELYNERPAAEKIAEAQKAEEEQAQTNMEHEFVQKSADDLRKEALDKLVEARDNAQKEEIIKTTETAAQDTITSMSPGTKVGEEATPGPLESTLDEKKVDETTWKLGIDSANDREEIAKALEEKTKGMSKDAENALVDKIIEMNQQKGPALQTHAETQLGPQMTGEPIVAKDLNDAYPRTLPLKLALGAMTAFGRRADFLNWARGHYGQEFAQKFQIKPPASIAEEIIQGFKTDKTTKDLIRHIATDNLADAMRESWGIATELTHGLVAQGLLPDAKPKTIQDVNRKFGCLMSLASEERRANGEKTYLGIQRQMDPSGKDDNFQKVYLKTLETFGLPKPDPQTLGTRPELAFTNILHQIAGDRAEKLLMWTKNEMEEPVFKAMVKAGVFNQTGIMANVAFGYAPRIHDLKDAQKEYQQGRGSVGDPTKSSGVLQRECFDYSDFLVRSQQQGLDVVPHYMDAMSEYVQQSLAKSMQYNTLNWLRMFRIPNTDTMGIPGHATEKVREIIRNLNYVEYASSQNIQELSKLTGLKANDILMHLGYFNDKEAEGLVGWNKFHFEKPFMQGPLHDVLNFYYPKTAMQSEAASNIVGVLNAPKWMMVALDPLQHVALFSTAVLGNSGWRLPSVMTRGAIFAYKSLANMPFAALAYAKGEPQTRMAMLAGGGPIEPGYENQENLAKFLTYGHGAALGVLPEGMFQDQKIQKYLIPEMMSGRQGMDAAVRTTLSATKIMFGHFLQREIYNVTNQRYNHFRGLVDAQGNKLMTDEEAARRAVNLINSTSGVVHPSDFGPYGPAWSLLTFARGLTIAQLRVITGTVEPTLRKIYGNTNKFKIDPVSGMLNPIRMGDVSAKDADFLQAYYAQHLAKIIAMRVLAAGVVQYAMSFGDDDKKDEFGQQGNDPLNKKRFIYNNPAGMRMSIRTPWTTINGQRVVLNPTPFREAAQLVQMTGLGAKNKFPEATMDWIRNRLNVWESLFYGAATGVDVGTGREIPGNGTDSYGDELTKWMMAKVMPLSLGFTQAEKEQRIAEPGAQGLNRLGAFFGSTPSVFPKNWFPGYEEAQQAEKEFQEKKLQAKDAARTMTKEEVARMSLTKYFTRKEQENIEQGKGYDAKKVMQMMKQARKDASVLQAPEPERATQLQP